jgi:hypothetical protein
VLLKLGLLVAALGVVAALGPVAGAAADSCPNAAYRTGPSASLPDCRAYELVTNAFLEGQPVVVTDHGLPLGSDTVIGADLGAGAGTGQDSGLSGAYYAFGRTSSGWSATPLDPPTAEYANADMEDVSSDLSAALFLTAPPNDHTEGEQDADEIVVRNSNGSFTQVGPLFPSVAVANTLGANSFTYMGASADLSHVLFLELGGTWPGDTASGTGVNSLYEWVAGSGSQDPELVGVDDAGDVISDCGTTLGSYVSPTEESTYNAISSSGATIYFTADGPDINTCGGSQPAVDQLYARVDGSQTVPISAPSPDGCTTAACQSAPAADAFFEGASADGSKVFFASTQQLLDGAAEDDTSGDNAFPTNSNGEQGCAATSGASGCNLYEYDFDNPAGDNLVDVSGGSIDPQVQGVARISEDGSHVYFVAKGVLAANQGAATDPNTGQPEVAAQGADNLYVFERDSSYPDGRTTFIAQLSPSDSSDWSSGDDRRVQATPDGDYLVFPSVEDLTVDDSSTVPQLFEYDATAGTLTRISHGQDGYNSDGNTDTGAATPTLPVQNFGFFGAMPVAQASGRAISSDGSVVAFYSPDALTPDAVNDAADGAENVYEWEAPGSGSCAAGSADGCVFLVSDGHDATCGPSGFICGSSLWGIDPSGENIYFSTSDPLTWADQNTQVDMYDARVDGGFPPPTPAPSCSADACQGPSPPQASVSLAATVSFTGPGNPPNGRVQVVRRAVHGDWFAIQVRVSAGGVVTVAGRGVRRVRRTVKRAGQLRLVVHLTAQAQRQLRRRHRLRLAVRVAFTLAGGFPADVQLVVNLRSPAHSKRKDRAGIRRSSR